MTTVSVARGVPWRGLRAGLVAFVIFEAAWVACVVGAARGWAGTGVAVVAVVVLLHLAVTARRRLELALIAAAVAVGLVWDSLLIQAGWVHYASPGPVPEIAPTWILALWALLAITLSGPLQTLQRRPLVSALLGAVGGPLSYWGAQRLGACVLSPQALPVLALGWAVLLPSLLALARHLDAKGLR
jgi:hypothetical protein